ncbi:methyltransferase domain-containing protein [Streptomyces sp. NPDC015345]|uniref:class I SAM-dependent methyltransferase n=1 Tax=Streptomyces sp. NPDC015345 TaxID=3364953 RepID=UPI003700E308
MDRAQGQAMDTDQTATAMGTDPMAASYSDANPFFRLFRHLGWGALVNLGYYTLPTLPALLGGLAFFQRRLETRSLDLLQARPGHRVLDACCGRGHTTARLGAAGCSALGVDISVQQIAEAVRRYGTTPNTAFAVADVTALPVRTKDVPVAGETFDRVHCLEAAFHLTPAGRRTFVAEAFRVLRPGGRFVLVDFTWHTADPTAIGPLDPRGLVRAAWQVDGFEPLVRYLAHARETGFLVRRTVDWTRPVVERSLRLGAVFARVAATRAGREALCARWPGLREFTPSDWHATITVIDAHRSVAGAVRYSALVLDKPGGHEPGRP